MKKFLINTFLGGMMVLLPISLFILLIRFIFNLLMGIVEPLLGLLGIDPDAQNWFLDMIISLSSLAVIVILCFLIGLAVRTRLGMQFWKDIEEEFLYKLPLYTSIKEVVLQITGKAAKNFSKVVVVDVFGNGTLMTGFVTDEHDNGLLTVFVPTAPNPTNGFVFHVHTDQIRFLETNTEQAMRSIIAVGSGSSDVMSAEKLSALQPTPPYRTDESEKLIPPSSND